MKETRGGFTIIEVVLVLAVAGLIFLIAFTALPALQVSSRDTQRRDDIATIVTNIKNYQTNNRGALPDLNSSNNIVYGDRVESNNYGTAGDNTWQAFYRDYLGKTFRDPLGYMYNLKIEECNANPDSDCSGYSSNSSRLSIVANKGFSDNGYYIVIVPGATCYGDKAVGTASPRKVAVLYKLEGAGTYCQGT